MAKITAKTIAQMLNVSPSAVSLALNGKPGVSEDTRAKVLEAAMKMGYAKGSGSKQPLIERKLCFIRYAGNLVKIAEHTSFSSFVLQGVEARASELGYSTQVRYLNSGDMYNPQILEALRQMDGIIFLGTDITQTQLPEIERLLTTIDSCPVVIVDSALLAGRLDCVVNDCFGGAKYAIEHLLQTGHRQIGYVRSNQRTHSLDLREQGVFAAVAAAKAANPVVIGADVSSEGAYRDVDNWIRTHHTMPDAIFADNDILAASTMRALKNNGYRIPADVSVIGFDDLPTCELLDPPLSSVHAFKEDLGTLAVEQLHRRILKGEIPHQMGNVCLVTTTLSTRLVSRSSLRVR